MTRLVDPFTETREPWFPPLMGKEPTTLDEAQKQMEAAARRMRICFDAREYDEARHQLSECKRLAMLAVQLNHNRRVA